MLHAEALLFVHNHHTDVLEDDIGRKQSVRSHDQIDRPVCESLDHLALLCGRTVTAQ